MAYIPPWQRLCDCRCLVHHQQPRTTYTDPDCACTITCATQPLTLLADRWGCALFLDHGGDLWHVPAMANGTFDWAYAAEIDSRHDSYDASRTIEHLLRQAAHVLQASIN
ncbi:hypothetical protein O7605_31785 [Verrucosispora sp. WMMA2121]|uniref:hypothetical protein n=1 Tax=Verrucosispora sp. WMMA2121 TaxID=3015164 RepID=UPI0022B7429E|nr:hypothetical protein [Verrucosispora sp. WMMA2121]MCZ7423779.1 hypothetical protein [Verrucosispora sp. WMMA2121]MCZ7424079.1 hypothetical protein [Verrucosispora sp. WMMA2121]MCZ7424094.1 hypothetical protein [Verrucosispora sp. WMMA2121]